MIEGSWQLPGEPAKWYIRYSRYRLAGPGRTVDRVWRGEAPNGAKGRSAPGSWDRAVRRWRWAERASAWDLAEVHRLAEEDAADRIEARQWRRALLHEAAGKVEAALAAMDPTKMSAFATVLAAAKIARELRREFDDEPTQRHQLGGLGGGPVVITLDLTPPRDWLGDTPPEDMGGAIDDEGVGGHE